MEVTKKQAEFWAFIIIMCTAAAIAVLLIDFGIKAAILEESTRLRLLIEDQERNGHRHTETDANGTNDDSANDSAVSRDVLVVDAFGMEAGHVPDGTTGPVDDTSDRGVESR